MRIALAQINPTLGDFKNNRIKIEEYIHKAQERRCSMIVFPECALFGYYPADLLERPDIVDKQLKELDVLHKKVPEGMTVFVGAITKSPYKKGKPYNNSCVVLQKNKKQKVYAKELLPTYDVFDEARHIEPGNLEKNIFRINGKKILITICEDIWAWPLERTGKSNYPINPLKKVKGQDIDLVINLSGSPYTTSKSQDRIDVIKKTCRYLKAPMVYVSMIGGQDELIFDGGSTVVDQKGSVLLSTQDFEEDLNVMDFKLAEGGHRDNSNDEIERVHRALVLGIRDFANKNGIKKMHLGLSGGIDSAVVACLAVDALGPANVAGIAMPSEFNSAKSLLLAEELAKSLNIKFHELPIKNTYETALISFSESIGHDEFSLVNENMQARLRGMFLMAYSNKYGSMLLNTSNKSEFATGYSTLYGDLCGGLSPLGDLLKGQVYDLANYYNNEAIVIPEEIITRPPSAELRPDQKDEDSLPPYDQLDKSVSKLVEYCKPARGETEKWLLAQMMKSEFKRWQAPPVLKVTRHSFGRGRRFPITHKSY